MRNFWGEHVAGCSWQKNYGVFAGYDFAVNFRIYVAELLRESCKLNSRLDSPKQDILIKQDKHLPKIKPSHAFRFVPSGKPHHPLKVGRMIFQTIPRPKPTRCVLLIDFSGPNGGMFHYSSLRGNHLKDGGRIYASSPRISVISDKGFLIKVQKFD